MCQAKIARARQHGTELDGRVALWASMSHLGPESSISDDGRLVDASDLPFSDGLLDDDGMPNAEKVREAVEALAANKPQLAAIRPTGDVGRVCSTPTRRQDLPTCCGRALGPGPARRSKTSWRSRDVGARVV